MHLSQVQPLLPLHASHTAQSCAQEVTAPHVLCRTANPCNKYYPFIMFCLSIPCS